VNDDDADDDADADGVPWHLSGWYFLFEFVGE